MSADGSETGFCCVCLAEASALQLQTAEYALWYDALYARGFADDLWNARSAVEFLHCQRKQEQQIK